MEYNQNNSKQKEENKKKGSKPFLLWISAHKVITTAIVASILAGAIATLGTLAGVGVFTPKGGNGGEVDPEPTPEPEPDPDPYTEITVEEAQSWYESNYESDLPTDVDATFSFDFSNTSSSDWEASKSGVASPSNVASFSAGFSGDQSVSTWGFLSDANDFQKSSYDNPSFKALSGPNCSWSTFKSRYGSGFINIEYYVNKDNSILRYKAVFYGGGVGSSGTRITELYISSDNCTLIEFNNVYKLFCISGGAVKNLNGTVTFKINKVNQ